MAIESTTVPSSATSLQTLFVVSAATLGTWRATVQTDSVAATPATKVQASTVPRDALAAAMQSTGRWRYVPSTYNQSLTLTICRTSCKNCQETPPTAQLDASKQPQPVAIHGIKVATAVAARVLDPGNLVHLHSLAALLLGNNVIDRMTTPVLVHLQLHGLNLLKTTNMAATALLPVLLGALLRGRVRPLHLLRLLVAIMAMVAILATTKVATVLLQQRLHQVSATSSSNIASKLLLHHPPIFLHHLPTTVMPHHHHRVTLLHHLPRHRCAWEYGIQ